MYFAVGPARAALSDINGDLINAWHQVINNGNKLLSEIKKLSVDAETYYNMRESKPRSALQRAVRFIYLNRSCYGGLYRTNRDGAFNVPYGGGSRTPAPLWEAQQLLRARDVLVGCDLNLNKKDFGQALRTARAGDVCFLDPTYTAIKRGPFDRYNAKLFTWEDQKRLRQVVKSARSRGAVVVVSNVDCAEIRSLYQGELVIPLQRAKAIGNMVKNSRSKRELLIVCDDPSWHGQWASAAKGKHTPSRESVGSHRISVDAHCGISATIERRLA